MKIQQIQNTNFKGCTNVIGLKNALIGDSFVTYISTKLNNEVTPDLDRFHEICKIKNLLPEGENSDVLTFMYKFNVETKKDGLFLQNKRLCWGDELARLGQKHSDEEYKLFEDFHIKMYTFLADITKRLSNQKFPLKDNDLANVLKNTFSSLSHNVKSEQKGYYLLRAGLMGISPFQEASGALNRTIVLTMKKFFKIG